MITIRHIAAIAALCSLPALVLAQADKPAAEKPAAPAKAEAKDDKVAPKPVARRLTAWRSPSHQPRLRGNQRTACR